MQNPIPKFWQGSIIYEKSGYLPEKLKTLTSSNYLRKGVRDFFILLRS